MGIYQTKPERFLEERHIENKKSPASRICCAGFELEVWRSQQFADHLVEWLPDYALIEDELDTNHGNAFVKLRQAAIRVYTSEKFKKRGEAGEIALHAICRDFFNTIPISPRVFYKSTSNDVVKSFDLVHVNFPKQKEFEIWLGESKLYTDANGAVLAAIASIKDHLEKGFLTNQKLILGPQIPKSTPNYDKIIKVFKTQTSIDDFLSSAVFVVGILCDSDAVKSTKSVTPKYIQAAIEELNAIVEKISSTKFGVQLKIQVVYVPLADKKNFFTAFDQRLKALQ
jgi:uncharacterized protein DUF1837